MRFINLFKGLKKQYLRRIIILVLVVKNLSLWRVVFVSVNE